MGLEPMNNYTDKISNFAPLTARQSQLFKRKVTILP